MFHRLGIAIVVATAFLLGSRAAVAASPAPPQAPPPDPAIAGEWLAFCWIQLPADLSPEARQAWNVTLRSVVNDTAAWVFPEKSPERAKIAAAVAAAADGKATAIWVLPPSNNEAGGAITVTTLDEILARPANSLISLASAEWPAHRTKSAAARAGGAGRGGAPAIEFAVNINNARRHFGPAFDPSVALGNGGGGGGRAVRVLDSLSLGNARIAGLHVRLLAPAAVKTRDPSVPRVGDERGNEAAYTGPMLAVVEATWSARSEPPGKVYISELTTDYWPQAQVGVPASGSAAVAAVRTMWRTQMLSALRVYGALLPTEDWSRFEKQAPGWLQSNSAAVTRLVSTVDPWVRLGLATDKPGEVSFGAMLRDDAAASATAQAFSAVVTSPAIGGKAIGSSSPWRWTTTADAAQGKGGWWVRGVEWMLTERKAPERSAIEGRVRFQHADSK